MAAGDIIIPGNTITPEIMQKIAAEITKLINTNAKDPGQWEVVTSTNGVTSLPVLQVMGSTYKLVRLAVSTLQGVNGREVELQMNAEKTAIQWRYVAVSRSDLQPTEWRTLIEVSLLKGDPGETPNFRTGEKGIEWKYKTEDEGAWRVLIAYDVLKLKFSDLSADNIAEFWRGVPDDVMAEFQKPATDAAGEVRKEMTQISQEANTAITNVNTAKGNAEKATKDANDAAGLANTAAGQAKKAAGDADTATGLAVAAASLAKEKAGVANTAAGNADTAAANANSKANLANTSAGTANTAAENANNKAGLANTAATAANTAAELANKKAELANTAANTANTAAERTNKATSNAGVATKLANDAATAANTAKGNADTAAAAANTAKDNANKATSDANTAAGKANDAATKANTATSNANTATGKANDAASLATTAAGNANTAAGRVDNAIASAGQATKAANNAAAAATTAKDNAVTATGKANDAAKLANDKAGQANTAATAANTAKENAVTATGNANKATDRANTAAENAEKIAKGFQADWNVSDSADPNYIKNRPEIPTLDAMPTGETSSYVNSAGTTVSFRIGDEVRVLEDGEYVFYKLYDLAAGVASWQESGSGTALPGNIYLQGANYYNESVQIIKEGYLNE